MELWVLEGAVGPGDPCQASRAVKALEDCYESSWYECQVRLCLASHVNPK